MKISKKGYLNFISIPIFQSVNLFMDWRMGRKYKKCNKCFLQKMVFADPAFSCCVDRWGYPRGDKE